MEVEWLALKDLSSPRKSFRAGLDEEGVGLTEQKENIFVERRKSMVLKSPDSASPMAYTRKGPVPDMVHVTPVKHTVTAAAVEPLTPTANLKMLISAASPDIRDREMKKVLFRPIENEELKPATPESPTEDEEKDDSCQFEGAEEENDPDKKPSRKQKSLGLLCQKFLALYPDNPPANSPTWISLDEVSNNLGVERRRIYDIINVLESLMMVGRIAKNSYTWFGRQRLEATLQELQQRGRQQGYHLQTEVAKAGEGAAWRDEDVAEGDGSNTGANRKDKSLRIMSQKFVMLFLVSKTQTVTLDAAARTLIDESQDLSSHSKYKTKVRRLYDIANVLTSLGLIKKVHVREEKGRKPAFKWLGPVEFNNSVNRAQPTDALDLRSAKMQRHASFNVTPISTTSPAAAQRQFNSAPCSPLSEFTEHQTQPLDYSKKTGGNGSCTVTHLHTGNCSDSQSAAFSAQQRPPPLPASPHCLAYLPSLSQPSVVMLYRPDQVAGGPGSPLAEGVEGRKRKRDESEEEEKTKRHMSELQGKLIGGGASLFQSGQLKADKDPCTSGESTQYSHYLYVPNSAGLNSVNFLLSAGQQPAGLTLAAGSVPTLALPYVLLPTSSLPSYPLEACAKLSLGVPAAMPQSPVVVGRVPYALAAATTDTAAVATSSPSSPKGGGAAGKPQLSPSAPYPKTSINECMTPQTPKEAASSAASTLTPFFRTPAHTLGSAVEAARKRGSAQRRLDVGHAPVQPQAS